MNKCKQWYNENKAIRILFWVIIVFIISTTLYKTTRFILSRYNDETPEGAIRTEVMRNWTQEGSYFECLLYKSMFLKAEKVEGELAECWYNAGYDRKTQMIYQITENCPNNQSGFWIVTEFDNNGYTYYLAKYGGF